MFVAQPHAHTPSHAVTSHPVAHHAGERPVAADTVEIDSNRLLKGQRELLIRHGNECYRLRHTRNDKLILTK
jgi:hemin uptake protein HemP